MRSLFKGLIVLLFLGALSLSVAAQTNIYTRVLYDMEYGLHVYTTTPAPDDGLYVTGLRYDNSGYMLKVDSAGFVVWSKKLILDNATVNLTDVKTCSDSTIITTGIVYANNQSYLAIVKWDIAGDAIWTKTVSWPQAIYSARLCVTATDDILIVGYTEIYTSGSIAEAFALRFTKDGILQWSKKYTNSTFNIYGYSIAELPNGNITIAGKRQTKTNYTDKWLSFELEPSGEVISAFTMDSPDGYGYKAVDLIAVDDGIVYYSYTDQGGLLKLDYSGNLLWARDYSIYSYSFYLNTQGNLIRTSDNGFVVTSSDMILKTDAEGIPEFKQAVFMDVVDVAQNDDNGFVVAGNGPMIGVKTAPEYIPQVGLYRTDTEGNSGECIYPNITQFESYTPTFTSFDINSQTAGEFTNLDITIEDFELLNDSSCVAQGGGILKRPAKTRSLYISPNPVKSMLTVQFPDEDHAIVDQIDIIDSFGRVVWSVTNYSELKNGINVSSFTDGIYFLRIISNKEVYTGKFIKTK